MKLNLNLIKSSHGEPKGTVVAIPVSDEVANKLHIPGGIPKHEMHVSLFYIKNMTDFGSLLKVVNEYSGEKPLKPIMKIGGIGRFFHEGKDVIYASIDSPILSTFREGLGKHLLLNGIEYSIEHGFVPHITLAYVGKNIPTPRLSEDAALSWVVSSIEVWNNNVRFSL